MGYPPVCFATRQDWAFAERAPTPSLATHHGEAFARLLDVLLCGEESAALAFDNLNQRLPNNALREIALDELRHEQLLGTLRAQLPQTQPDTLFSSKARRFFRTIEARDFGLHLVSITALDSGICQILRSLLDKGKPLAADPVCENRLRTIWRDEAHHVAISLSTALPMTDEKTRYERMIEIRRRLIALLTLRGAEFEALEVDADALFASLRQIPSRYC